MVALLAALAPPALASPEDPAADEWAFVAALNNARAGQGLAPLTVDAQLTGLARGWAQQMADVEQISHANPISAGVTADWLKLGENVGTGGSVGPIMNAFLASPGHYANIMDPEFTRVGVGVVWNGNALYTTHRFMKVAGEPGTPPPPPAPEPEPAPPAPEPLPPPPPQPSAPRQVPEPSAPPTTVPAPPAPPPAPPAASAGRVAVVLAALAALDAAR